MSSVGRAPKVAIWPAFRKARDNAYSAMFATSLVDAGLDVIEFSTRSALGRYDALVVHWPEIGLNRRNPVTRLLLALATIAALWLQRVRGTRVIWVTHNTHPHNVRCRRLSTVFYWFMTRSLSGLIHPSDASRSAVYRDFSHLVPLPAVQAPLGRYEPPRISAAEVAAVAREFGIAESSKVILNFGQMREYKGVPELLRAVRDTPDPDLRVVAVGSCNDPDLRSELMRAAGGDTRVTLDLSHVPDHTLSCLLERALLVVTPFRRVLNSGSVIHALSAGRPVFAPFSGGLRELAQQVGPDWMRELTTPLDSAQLASAVAWAAEREISGEPDLGPTWSETAAAVRSWLEDLSEHA
jgi:beta-1,4-mannosyltransferase